jgi:hypothetical protein
MTYLADEIVCQMVGCSTHDLQLLCPAIAVLMAVVMHARKKGGKSGTYHWWSDTMI